ncbi:MAG: class I SAM-dependent methyltransferase [Chloroflexota bacterium]|nr:class I SAM-dependent methyltransferase [Chloroflexota bacterium]
MINERLVELARCPRCVGDRPDEQERGRLKAEGTDFVCGTCRAVYGIQGGKSEANLPLDDISLLPRSGYLDLTLPTELEQQTKYLEEEFEQELDYEHISLPLLGAKVRNDLLRKLLRPARNEIALEVGCGNGKFCYWNRQRFDTVVGLDAAPLFAEEALAEIPLVQGDVRRLPFAPASFDKIFSIDLLEHLPASGIEPFFRELSRVLKPGGRILIYSNTREMGKLAPIIQFEKKVARFFSERGLFDFKRDDLRKSDHIKALRTFEDLESAVGNVGFVIERKVFWNGVFQGLVDNIIIKAGEYVVRQGIRLQLSRQEAKRKQEGESVRSRLASATTGLTNDWADGGGHQRMQMEIEENRAIKQAEKVAMEAEQSAEESSALDLAIRRSLKRSIADRRSGSVLRVLRFLTLLQQLDIIFFGKMRTGPYFVVLKRR